MVMIAQMKDEENMKQKIREAVRDMYTEVSEKPSNKFHFPLGEQALLAVGYPKSVLKAVPKNAKESFAGVGYHFQNNVVKKGNIVLDIGSGSGTDLIIVAQKVGSEGKVIGIDITQSMLKKALKNAEEAKLKNVSVIESDAESLPFKDDTFDVVISNGVINLVHDKQKTFKEIFRVLKPGGYMSIADIILSSPISEKSRANPELWASCVVGAMVDEEYLKIIKKAGFSSVEVVSELDYFALSDSDSTKRVAHSLGAHSVVIKAQKSR